MSEGFQTISILVLAFALLCAVTTAYKKSKVR